MKRISRLYIFLVYTLPAILFFSYYPVISFGTSESMNFEISLPIIWLVAFDILSFIILVKNKMLGKILEKWRWLLLPVFMSLSVIWSANMVRGILTMGVLWLIYFAVFALVILKEKVTFLKTFKKNFWKIFFGSSLVVCAWCFLQCILDVAGVPRECTLMCEGCVSQMFGFPHPNGFAIEPQFMGNLLIAPSIIASYLYITKTTPISDTLKGARLSLWSSIGVVLVFIFSATLFLTFSRGAIYACVIGLVFLTVFQIVLTKKWKAMLIWLIVGLAFLFILNLQGIFAEIGPTNDTYFSGVAKVLNHLSLGVIDVRAKDNGAEVSGDLDFSEETQALSSAQNNEAIFDGYVEESTEIRKELTRDALTLWSQDFGTMAFGVGIGGAGQALYDAGLTESPKEIVQNEFVSLLLEIGVVGVLLVVFTLALVIRMVVRNSAGGVLVSLMVAYGVSLCFFSGLPNALHIYLLPVLLSIIFENKNRLVL